MCHSVLDVESGLLYWFFIYVVNSFTSLVCIKNCCSNRFPSVHFFLIKNEPKIKSVWGNCCAPLTFEASWDKLRLVLALLRSLFLHTDGFRLWCNIYFDWISVFLICTEHRFVFTRWMCHSVLAVESRLLYSFLILRWMHFLFYWKENLEVSFKSATLILKQVQYDSLFRI